MVLHLFLLGDRVFARDCLKFDGLVRKAHEWFFALDFPYWYSLAQLEVESNCIWRTSLDGWGSIGYAQITPKFWEHELRTLFPQWQLRDSADYFNAQAYILSKLHKQNKCGKLYVTYQCYNRSCSKVMKENKSCNWKEGLKECNKRPIQICVWKKGDTCVQYKTDCDINYQYSLKVYRYGVSLQKWVIQRWSYW